MHTMTAYLSKIIEWVVCATAVIAIYAPIAILMNNNEQKKKKKHPVSLFVCHQFNELVTFSRHKCNKTINYLSKIW